MFQARLTLQNILFLYIVFPFKQSLFSTSFQRDSKFRVASFIDHVFHVLDIVELESILVRDRLDCVLQCLENKQFLQQTLLLALTSMEIDFDLPPRDRYNTSDSFRSSQHFQYYWLVRNTPAICQ